MKNYSLVLATLIGVAMTPGLANAQTNAGVDPACMMKDANGVDVVDKVKCPDGMTVGAAPAAPAAEQKMDSTASTTPAADSLIVPPDSLAGAKVMSSTDFVGKRVYAKAGGEDIGEVNDLILTDDGKVRAVILGVGGFLGIGEKDVAVTMASIEMAQDGNNVKLIVDGTKDQFTAAPAYDRTTRTYVK